MKPYYEDGGVTIYHGDCREVMPGMSVDAVVTDPPYGVGYAKWDDAPPTWWLRVARAVAPVIAFTTGPLGPWDYPSPDWLAAYSRQGSTARNNFGGFCHWTPVLIYGDARLPVDFFRSNDKAAHMDLRAEGATAHPCPKPVPVMRWLLNSLDPDSVLDPFMGSGSVLRAARDDGRRAIGIEIEECYCEIAANRLAQGVLPFA